MKTLYNYFPTKESMVLDDADELIENLAAALRDRQAGMSITDAFVGALKASMYWTSLRSSSRPADRSRWEGDLE